MTSLRSYLINAVYAWIVDNNLTPYILIDVTHKQVNVPPQYREENQIILNIAPEVVNKLELGKEAVSFQARFNGVIHNIYAPNAAVMAVYAKENGRGMFFNEEEETEIDDSSVSTPEDKGTERPSLRVIRSDKKDKSE